MCCRSSKSTPRPERIAVRILAVLLLAGGGLASSASAQPLSDSALDERAREILAAHCAPCREAGVRDLAALARDPKLVRPGNPDGSPAYTELIRGLLTSATSPTVEELATVRAWIEKLPSAPVKRGAPSPLVSTKAEPSPNAPIDLHVHADRTRYKIGDEVRLTVRSTVDCRLIVISIDVTGHGTVIFPNDFASKDRLIANTDLALPAAGAGYRFRVKDKGRERVVALCTRASGLVDGITHDFERQRFQELGIYATFLDSALSSALKRKADGVDDTAHAPLDQIWRTGIVIEVE